MKNVGNAALGLLAAAAVVSASDVYELKKDTFEPFIKEHDLVLAEFFAPWCGHCKALAPEYEEAATTLREKNVALAKVDCTEEAELCASYGVEGYPTLKIFRGADNIAPYGGQRKAPAIISYMTKQSLPAVSAINKDTIEEFKAAGKVVLIAFYDATDAKSNKTFESVATTMRDNFLFGATNDEALAKAEGVKQPGLVLYKQFDEGKDVFDGKFDTEAIESFAKTSSTPLIGDVGPETYAGYMASGLPLGYIFAETEDERSKFAKEFKPIAEKHKGKINLATIDAKAFGQHAQNLNLEVGKWPAFAIQDTGKNQKFPMDAKTKLSEKNVGKFVDDFLAGKVEPSIKSEPIPEKQDGPVTVVVAHNYKDIVMDETKDVLLEFYAPWCGHCKALAPKYEELATLFAPHSAQVTIAKVDATANDVPDEISGFPTIKLYPAGAGKAPIDYAGSRSIEDLAKFVAENGSHKVGVLDVDTGMSDPDEVVKSKGSVAPSEDMPHQAPAATKAASDSESKSVSGTVTTGENGEPVETEKGTAEKMVERVEEVIEAVMGEAGGMDEHDEL